MLQHLFSLGKFLQIWLFLSRTKCQVRRVTALTLGFVVAVSCPVLALPATTTTLAVTSGGSAVTTVSWGSVVTLTATVVAGTTPVTVGQVEFCDAAAAHCEDIHIIATAQLTSAGKAVFNFRPGIGSHSYKAVFAGTKTVAGSASVAAALTVTHTGTLPTSTGIVSSGSVGNYTLTATVGGNGSVAPTGTVSFLDTSDGNAVVGTAPLGSAAALGFLNSSNPPVGFTQLHVAVADFNGDGIPDVAVTGFSCCGTCTNNGSVMVLLGNGDGTFTASPTSPSTGVCPVAMVAGDFNGDGIPDLVVVNLGSTQSSLTILIGKGDGTFTPTPTSPSLLFDSNRIMAADLNRDGNLDLVIGSLYGLTVLLGNGDGTFSAPPGQPAGNLNLLTAGDFNGDGIPDLVAGYAGSLQVLLGVGDGTFTELSQNYGYDTVAAVAADFNGDGKLDLALAGQLDGGTVLIGNGDGTFTAAGTKLLMGSDGLNISVGDFNGDGIPDLAVSTSNSPNDSGTIHILLGNGDATFSTTVSPFPGGGINVLSAADINGDGRQDIVTQPITSANDLSIWLAENQTATATVTGVAMPIATGVHTIEASYPGDSNYAASVSFTTSLTAAQGTPTVSVTPSANPVQYGTSLTLTAHVSGSGLTPTGTVTFLDGTTQLGSATLGSGVAIYSSSTLSKGVHFISVSYTGDSNYVAANSSLLAESVKSVGQAASALTLAVSSGGTAVTSVSSGTAVTLTATAKAAGTTTPVTPGTVQFCDATVNANCTGLAVIGSAQLTSSGTAALTLRLGIGAHSLCAIFNGNSTYAVSASASSPLAVTGQIATTTVLGPPANGRVSAVVSGAGFPFMSYPTGTVQFIDTSDSNLLLATATVGPMSFFTGAFNSGPQAPATGHKPFSIAAGDLNHDGIPDMVAANSSDNTVSVLIGNGDGTYRTQVTYAAGRGAFAVAIGDFDGDGNPDLAVANFTDNTVSILLGNGDGTFKAQQTYGTGSAPNAIAVGDFNGDGNLDLAVANNSDGTVSILLGNGDGSFSAQRSYATGHGPAQLVSADFNRDGIPDLAVANNTDGTVSVLLGNGDGTFTAQVPYTVGKNPISLTAADFNGDSFLDLAVANLSDNTVSVLVGNGDGTFQAATNRWWKTGTSPYAVVAGDWNGDGLVDLAVANSGSSSVSLLLNVGGTALFTAGQTYSAGTSPIAIAAADLNGDGEPDLAVLDNTGNAVNLLLDSSGFVSQALAIDFGLPGSNTVKAEYSGDSNYSGSFGVFDYVNPKQTTALTLSTSANPSNYGATVTLTAALSPFTNTPLNVNTNGETVTFMNGGNLLGTGTLSAGVSTLTTSSLGAGSDSLQASFAGDAYFAASTSNSFSQTVRPATMTVQGPNVSRAFGQPNPSLNGTASGAVNGDTVTVTGTTTATPTSPVGNYPVVPTASGPAIANYTVTAVNGTLTVNQATPAITLASSANAAYVSNPVTFTATVSSSAGTATGTVSFNDGTTLLGAGTLSAGVATYTTSSLAAGSHTIKAVYSGDSNFVTVTSTTVTETIETFTIGTATAGGPTTFSGSPGGQASFVFAVAPPSGMTFAGPIGFTASGLPAGFTALFSPATVPAGSGATNVTMTVNLPSTAEAQPLHRPFGGGLLPVALGLLLLPFAGRLRRVSRGLKGMVCLLVLVLGLAAAALVTGCGGGGGGQSSTPARNYTVTITGSSGSLSTSFTVTLIVQ